MYTKPSCPQCRMTELQLDRHGATLPAVDITRDEAALAFVLGLGYKQAPVVYIDADNHWSGFRPDLINTHFKKEN